MDKLNHADRMWNRVNEKDPYPGWEGSRNGKLEPQLNDAMCLYKLDKEYSSVS